MLLSVSYLLLSFGAHLRNIIVSVCRQRVRAIFDTHRFQQAVTRQNESAGSLPTFAPGTAAEVSYSLLLALYSVNKFDRTTRPMSL
jgi:hypothetical protein